MILQASPTLRATPAMPPAPRTTPSHVSCSGRIRPVGVLTSMEVKTATRWPTISGVITTVRQPIRSAEPRARPKVTSRPVRGSGKLPTWLRNRRVSARVPTASLMRCCRSVSALGTFTHAVAAQNKRVLPNRLGFSCPGLGRHELVLGVCGLSSARRSAAAPPPAATLSVHHPVGGLCEVVAHTLHRSMGTLAPA
jgi:hypothetical protein